MGLTICILVTNSIQANMPNCRFCFALLTKFHPFAEKNPTFTEGCSLTIRQFLVLLRTKTKSALKSYNQLF